MAKEHDDLLKVLDKLSLDRAQRKAAKEGVAKLTRTQAKKMTKEIQQALDALPVVLKELSLALDKMVRSELTKKGRR